MGEALGSSVGFFVWKECVFVSLCVVDNKKIGPSQLKDALKDASNKVEKMSQRCL